MSPSMNSCHRFVETVRIPAIRLVLVIIASGLVAGVFTGFSAPLAQAAEAVPGARPVDANAVYMQPITGLDEAQLKQFRAGEKLFRTSWIVFPLLAIPNWEYVRPPSMIAWGLGPTFIANACMACHVQAGHGKTVEQKGSPISQQLVRISIPGTGPHGEPLPHPHYGHQLQPFDVITPDKVHVKEGEANVMVDWIPHIVTLPDGSQIELRKPSIRIEQPAFGPLGDNILTSLRNSRAVFGLGYLEAVSEEDILAMAKLQTTQGLNGRPNYVRDDVNDKTTLGRFGWKANQPSVRQQIAAAFHGDMGITSPLYLKQDCPPVQKHCQAMPPGDKAELRAYELDEITLWAMALDAPLARDRDKETVRRGEQLFHQARCAQCHVPELKTGHFPSLPALSNRRFQAYTDLLLHDMGEGLADGRPDFRAGPRDWRTPPLWGIGLSKQVNGSTNLLHDGRARNVLEAILWHGGEAQKSRDAFAGMSEAEREAVVAFVNAL